jgi:hypothetical protein
MESADRSKSRPPLNPADIYRPRLGAQREPLSKSAMMELQAWREVSRQGGTEGSERTA